MSYVEVVVGFDTRVAPNGEAPGWDADRRGLYLLKDVPWPLSVDEAVWVRKDTDMVYGEGLTVFTPKFRTADEARAAAGPDEWAIAITQWTGRGEPEVLDPCGPVDPAWQRLGWDVAEGVFPSGLSNCGWSDDDAARFAGRFASGLNDWHLFDDLPTAFAFRDANAGRIPEHGPWGVIGLYRV